MDSEPAGTTLHAGACCVLRIRDLPVIQSRDHTQLLDAIHKSSLILPSSPSSSSASISFPGVVVLVVSDAPSWESILATLSAFVCSCSIQTSISQYHERLGDTVTRRKFWHWLAYALFRREARHNVTKLHFRPTSIRADEVEMMRDVPEAEGPLAVLMDEPQRLNREKDDDAWVSASRFYYALLPPSWVTSYPCRAVSRQTHAPSHGPFS